MAKHNFKVIPCGANHVYFQCQNCSRGLSIESPVWFEIVVNRDNRLSQLPSSYWICPAQPPKLEIPRFGGWGIS